ncbi:MAG: hypothetical protein LBR38_08730 [Synergistaceae bacterium]|jgi:RNA ligase (TIGR02306 family)|nr:hypothetical protein [Synergistaceae bacterium]
MLTYEREVGHCSPTKYAKAVTIKELLPAVNSDNLERVKFNELGWETVVRRGMYHVGDRLMFIPPDSVLPLELSDALDVTKYLSKGRVKVVKLRGNRSEGLIVDSDICEPYLPYILQWEDLPSSSMRGETMPASQVPVIDFPVFYKIPSLMNEPDTFRDGEEVYVSEKIHGTNTRFGLHRHPETGEPTLYVGSHNMVLKEGDSVYWQAVRATLGDKAERLPLGVTFFGETYGRGVQDLDYGEALALRVFASFDGESAYHSVERTKALCEEAGLPCVVFDRRRMEGMETARGWADEPSGLTGKHVREGIVLRETEGDFRAAKIVSEKYLTRKGGVERH